MQGAYWGWWGKARRMSQYAGVAAVFQAPEWSVLKARIACPVPPLATLRTDWPASPLLPEEASNLYIFHVVAHSPDFPSLLPPSLGVSVAPKGPAKSINSEKGIFESAILTRLLLLIVHLHFLPIFSKKFTRLLFSLRVF